VAIPIRADRPRFRHTAGRIVYAALADFVRQVEEIRILDGAGDRLIATDKDGCIHTVRQLLLHLCAQRSYKTAGPSSQPPQSAHH
jgi:hypothetical protein